MKKKIADVTIIPGCISCGTCEVICPQVFKVTDVSRVQQGADFNEHTQDIEEAVDMCPVSVIQIEEKE